MIGYMLWLLALGAALGATYGVGYMLWEWATRTESDRWGNALEGVTIAYAVLAVVFWLALLLWSINQTGPGEHRWKGGDGPATECWHETEEGAVINGVKYSDTLYTVCGPAGSGPDR